MSDYTNKVSLLRKIYLKYPDRFARWEAAEDTVQHHEGQIRALEAEIVLVKQRLAKAQRKAAAIYRALIKLPVDSEC